MTAPNHVAGGLFFAGFWTSFWNINIFQKPEYIVVAIIASLLPDIDHTKSTIGIAFLPVSRWLDKNYGHRTITHSLLFLTLSTVTVLFFEKTLLSKDLHGLTIIFFFGVLSHLIIDMVTIRGVPLLYPFRRNPCVIPGRAEYRVKSGSLRSEMASFMVFCALNFLCIDLYRQGFWFTYNNTFSTIEHVHFERANSPNFTLCQYFFIQEGREFRGLAPIVDSKESTLDLLINGKVVKLDYITPGMVLKAVNPVKTTIPFKYIRKSFYNEPEKTINAFCFNRIISGTIQSNETFLIHYYKPGSIETEETKTGTSQELANYTRVLISSNTNRTTKTNKAAIEKEIALKKQSLVQDKINFQKTYAEYYALRSRERALKKQIAATTDIAVKNSMENEVIRIINRLQFVPAPVYTNNTVTLEAIRQLSMQLKAKDSVTQYFNATLAYLDVPEALIKLLRN